MKAAVSEGRGRHRRPHPSRGPWTGRQFMGSTRHPKKQGYPPPAPSITAPHSPGALPGQLPHTAPQPQPREGTGLTSHSDAHSRIGNQFAAIRFSTSRW